MDPYISLTIAIVIFGALGSYAISHHRESRDGGWHTFGSSTYQFRRWRNGKWEYKEMTAEEAERHQLDNAL